MTHMLTLSLIILTLSLTAQKKELVETKEEVQALAVKDFEKSMTGPEGELFLFGQENKIEGIYSFLFFGNKT